MMTANQIAQMLKDVAWVEGLGDSMPATVQDLCCHVKALAACIAGLEEDLAQQMRDNASLRSQIRRPVMNTDSDHSRPDPNVWPDEHLANGMLCDAETLVRESTSGSLDRAVAGHIR